MDEQSSDLECRGCVDLLADYVDGNLETSQRIVDVILGWPLRKGARWNEFGGSFIYPMGEEFVAIGFVAGLEARRPAKLRFRRFQVVELLEPRGELERLEGSPGVTPARWRQVTARVLLEPATVGKARECVLKRNFSCFFFFGLGFR